MDDLTTTQGIVALAAAGVAAVALLWVIVLAVKLRRVRAAASATIPWVVVRSSTRPG